MTLSDAIYMTCERTESSLFAEPLNVLSNLVFFVAAWLLWKNYKQTRKKYDEERVGLITLLTLIGIGNIIFHVTALRWAMFANIVPVAVFMTFVLYVAMRRLIELSIPITIVLLVIFAAICGLTMAIPEPYRFNDAVAYLPSLLAIAIITLRLHQIAHPSTHYFVKAIFWFAAALTFRALDMPLCPTVYTGTFFLWHICDAMALYMLGQAMPERRQAPRE